MVVLGGGVVSYERGMPVLEQVQLREHLRCGSGFKVGSTNHVQGHLAHKKQPPHPQGHHKALGMVLLEGARGALFLMSEVPLYI